MKPVGVLHLDPARAVGEANVVGEHVGELHLLSDGQLGQDLREESNAGVSRQAWQRHVRPGVGWYGSAAVREIKHWWMYIGHGTCLH